MPRLGRSFPARPRLTRKPIFATARATTFPTGPVAYWKLDEASGTRIDSAGTSHLTDVNTVTSATGKISTAAQFVAANTEYLTVADNAALSLAAADLTVAGWFYFTTKTVGFAYMVAKYNGTLNEYALFYRSSSVDAVRMAVWTAGGNTVAEASTAAISTGGWFFVAATFTAATRIATISINNGPIVTGSAAAGTAGVDTTVDFQLGSDGAGGEFWDGRMDEIGIWKRVLTDAEISDLYNTGDGLTYTVTTHPFYWTTWRRRAAA